MYTFDVLHFPRPGFSEDPMTPIETQPLHLAPAPASFAKTEGQAVYLQSLLRGKTIAQTVQDLLEQGRLVSFTQLFDLVERLYQAGLIQNPAVAKYFEKIREHAQKTAPKKRSFLALMKKEDPREYLSKHPFFRSQNPLVTSLFCQHAEVVEVKAGTTLCQAGYLERDLFFVIEGEAAIYKTTDDQRRLLGFFGKGAVIGEVGFFVGELRTADVICTKPCKLVIIRYDEAAFGRIINKEIAKNLQIRFRVVHALAKSPFLQSIPEEALDSLMFAGHVRPAQEFEVLTKENDQGHTCFVVVSGSVVIKKGSKTLGVLGPGEAFGEIALFFTQGRRTATAMAQRDSLLLEIHAKDFYRLLGENLLLGREFEKLALSRAERLQAA